jgi:hypothetical protein
VLEQGTDHARRPRAVRVLHDQRVQPILAVQHLVQSPVVRQDADAAHPPVGRDPGTQQRVDVHRLVGTVEAAHPEVHDAGRH